MILVGSAKGLQNEDSRSADGGNDIAGFALEPVWKALKMSLRERTIINWYHIGLRCIEILSV